MPLVTASWNGLGPDLGATSREVFSTASESRVFASSGLSPRASASAIFWL